MTFEDLLLALDELKDLTNDAGKRHLEGIKSGVMALYNEMKLASQKPEKAPETAAPPVQAPPLEAPVHEPRKPEKVDKPVHAVKHVPKKRVSHR